MEYAKDLRNGKVVEAKNAVRSRSYACPRPGCGGRVYLPVVVIQRPHFRHFPGEGTPACDEYFPSSGESSARSVAEVEEDQSKLGLLLTQLDGRWGLGLRVPEIPSDELVETSLGALRSAFVEVYVGSERLIQVSALELRPGVGAARVDVVPSLQAFRTQPAGSWPASVSKERWFLESRGLDAKGALFRLRGGEWTRLLAGSGVHHGETLLLLADARCAPPDSIVSETHTRISSGGLQWGVWEVQLPSAPAASVLAWLDRLGHDVVPRPWGVELVTPPRRYSEGGEPVFWVGDSPVLALEAPQPAAVATVEFQSGTNSYFATVRPARSRFAYVKVSAHTPGLTRLAVDGERSAILNLIFVLRPQNTTLAERLGQSARLRIEIGHQLLEAWQEPAHKVRVPAQEQPQVRVDLGYETARARVTVWERRKQRSKRGLDARSVAREIEGTLESAERIEIDAGNLGRVTLLPVRATVEAPHVEQVRSHLAWRDHVVSMCSRVGNHPAPAVLEQPRAPESLAVRQVGPAALIRSRIALRRRRETGGTRQ